MTNTAVNSSILHNKSKILEILENYDAIKRDSKYNST